MFLFVAAVLLLAMSQGSSAQELEIDLYAEAYDNRDMIVVTWEVKSSQTFSTSDFRLEKSRLNSGRSINVSRLIESDSAPNSFRVEDTDLRKESNDETADTQVFVYTLFVNGEEYDSVQAGYTTNAVRRTWGSIKSMFQ